MSYNPTRTMFNSRFTAGYDIDSNGGLAGLPARAEAEKKAVSRMIRPQFRPEHTYKPNGLMALSDKGIKVFKDTHPGVLPWNLYKAGPAGQGYYDYNLECTLEVKQELVAAHARFGGWMRTAAGLPLLVRAIKQSVSSTGEGSVRTFVSLWALAEKYPSPHRLQRLIGAVQNRTIGILRAYDGRGCKLRSALMALAINGNVGKAALIATYRSLTGKSVTSYREARQNLINMHGHTICDARDGVTVHRTEIPTLVKFGVEVYSTVEKGKKGWKRGWLMVRGERSYHLTEARHGFGGEWVGSKYRNYSTPRGVVYAALAAWQAADEAAVLARDKFKHLLREDVTILVTREDSYRAGNCWQGTDAWIYSTGIGRDRWCVPAQALLARANEARVANVLAVANRAAGILLATME